MPTPETFLCGRASKKKFVPITKKINIKIHSFWKNIIFQKSLFLNNV